MKSSGTRALLAFAACVGTIVCYLFWYSAIEAKSAVVADLQSQIDRKKESASRIASARATLSEIAGDETSVQSHFISETGIVAFIDDIEKRGHLQKAEVSVLSVSKDDSKKRPAIAFAVSVTGAFDSVLRTIGSIEYSPYDLLISSLSLSQEDKGGWRADVKFIVGSIKASVTATTTHP